MKKIENVLIICTGNTARSPVAEYLAKHYAEKYKIILKISSCGLFNAFNYMQPLSKQYLDEKRIISSDFKPQVVSLQLLKNADLIITMEQYHKEQIINNYQLNNHFKSKIYTLKEFNGEKKDLDIIDPYYYSNGFYRKILGSIDENIKKMIFKIIDINNNLSE